jgi:hypothetical protein
MKYIAKMMLALLASVTLVIPAYAWDFSASGSLSSTFNQTTTKDSKDDDAISSMDVGSEGGAITLKSSHSDGDKSATFSYSVDYADGGLDQVLSVSGSSKVGKWTTTGSVDYNLGWNGTNGADMQGGEDAEEITVTDGTLTISLGDGSFISSQSTVAGGVAAGNVAAFNDDAAIGAYVGAPQRIAVGYKMSDTMSASFAYQADGDAAIFDEIADMDDMGTGYQTTAVGVGVNADVGAKVGFTFASGSQKSDNSNVDNGTTATTMGLGVSLAMGDMSPFFSYGSMSKKGKESKKNASEAAMGLGLTMKMGSDSVVFAYTTSTQKADTDGTDTQNATATGIELGYNTTVGAATLGIGYGTQSVSADTGDFMDDKTAKKDGYNMSDIEVKMAFSF